MSKANYENMQCIDKPIASLSSGESSTDLPFFTSATATFNPKPYLPLSSVSINRGKAVSETVKKTEIPLGAPLQKPLDVTPDDPDAVFIRYPNANLPDPDEYPDGLTYLAFVQNPEWFLVTDDFETTDGSKGSRVTYPNILEPPRGWFGDIKKDGSKATEGIQPVEHAFLRCTFCRRGYQGVNAKSMWRRHVLEKHKIPMSNRREGPNGAVESNRGSRSSNKENKRGSSAAPVTAPPVPAKLRTAYTAPNLADIRPLSSKTNLNHERALSSTEPKLASKAPEKEIDNPTTESPARCKEPQIVPDEGSKIFNNPNSPGHPAQLPPSSPLGEESLNASRIFGPGFTDSPNHRTLMPWKFPSPSHPLHCDPEDLCLAVPIGGIAGDGLRAGYVPVQMSPFPGMKTPAGLQFSSPAGPDSPLTRKFIHGRVLGWNRKTSNSKLPPITEPSPIRPYSGPLSFNAAPVVFESPEFPHSTDLEEGDTTFSSMSDWLDFSSPRKEIIESGTNSLPDTPLKRASSSSMLGELRLKSPIKGLSPSRKEARPRAGLGLNFKIGLSSSSSSKKRPRSDDDVPTNERRSGLQLLSPFKRKLLQDNIEEPPLTDGGSQSEDQSSSRESSPPPMKRRLTL